MMAPIVYITGAVCVSTALGGRVDAI
jgi:hypothetical protein